MQHKHPDVHQVPLQPHVERIAQDVAGVLVIRLGFGRLAILDEQPADVAPEPIDHRRVRIGFMVGVLMMQPMHEHPPRGRLLQIADAQDRQRVLEPERAFEAAVCEQAMKAGPDSQRAEDVIPNRQPQHAPPAEEVGQERQRNQQMKKRHAEDIRPDDPAFCCRPAAAAESAASARRSETALPVQIR